jgi:hypothetical protein
MNTSNSRFSLTFSQDETTTKVSLTLPTAQAKAWFHKTLLMLTGGSVVWVSAHLPIVLPPSPTHLPSIHSAPSPARPSTVTD